VLPGSPRAYRHPRPGPVEDRGASAVEFALVLPLLLLFLFGIIQYGYGLFQLQALTATVDDATQKAATGVTSCPLFARTLDDLAVDNGLDAAKVGDAKVRWLSAGGQTVGAPDPLGQVQVSATLVPFKIGIPFVPFPDTITRTKTTSLQNVLTLDLPGCP
jgi:TadE-like protein